MTKKETNFSGTLSEAVSVATSVAYTRQEIQKLKTEFVSLLEEKATEVIVEQVPGPVGPRGALGATGAQGSKGDKGDKGDVGERGEKGDVGQQGEIGPEGLAGIKGDKGDKGEQGQVGPQGEQGIQGVAGERGEKGEKGDRGADGKNGLDGRDGETGAVGPAGPIGETGLQGGQGLKGDKGDRGRDGQQGIQGSVGPRGEIGPQGIQGVAGKDGKDGDIKPVEEKFQKFIDNVQRDVNSFKTKVNAAILKNGPNDAWKATGSGEVNLRYLDDVDRDSITDGYVLSYDSANAKFTFVEQGGGDGTDQWARDQANAAYNYANTLALESGTLDTTARTTANSAWYTANLAYVTANSAWATANSALNQQSGDIDLFARSQANSAFNQANISYTVANNSWSTANASYIQANTGTALAQAAYDYANTLITGESAGTDNLARSIANSAFATANASTILAQAAYNYANTIVVPSLSGYATNTTVNLVWSTANNAYSQANLAFNTANSAWATANTQSDWNQTSNTAVDYIKNKPTIPDITPIQDALAVTGEPMGHADKSQSVISFNDATRTFTIAPANASFDVWVTGTKQTYTTPQSVSIANTSGSYYVYFDSNGLGVQSDFFIWDEQAPTSLIYYNANTGTAPYFADERHGTTLDWQTHEYLHRTRGAVIANGFSIGNYSVGGAVQIDIGNGTFFDEDLQIDVTHSNTPTANTWEQDLQGPAQIPMFYLSGTGWVRDNPTGYVNKQGASRPRYNLLSGGTWSVADIDANKYGTTFIVATNNLTYPIIGIMSQSSHANKGDAEGLEFSDLVLTGFPVAEFRLLYKVVFKADSLHGTLTSVWDLRQLSATTPSAAIGSDHGLLSGLGDDDHPQYLLRTDATAISSNVSSAFAQANTATSLAQAAYNFANTIVSDTQIDPFARSQANSAFAQANTATNNSSTANNIALSAFTQANTATTNSAIANNQAASAFSTANTANAKAQAAYDAANNSASSATAWYTANLAFDTANTKVSKSGDTMTGDLKFGGGGAILGNFANQEIELTSNPDNDVSGFYASERGAASVYANTDVQIITNNGGGGVFPIWNFNRDGTLTFPDNTIQTTAFTTAISNTISTVSTTANAAYQNSNSAFTQANTATTLAQAAYNTANTNNTANTKVSKSGDTMTGDLKFGGGGGILNLPTNRIEFTANVDNDVSGFYAQATGVSIVYANTDVIIQANTGGTLFSQWNFNKDGTITFPDSTTQTTAFTGTAIDSLARSIANSAFDKANTSVTYNQNLNTSNTVSFAGVTVTGNTTVQHVVPSANVTYDLGTPTARFRDLYLSGNTINLGSAQLSANGSTINLPPQTKVGNKNLSFEDISTITLDTAITSSDSGLNIFKTTRFKDLQLSSFSGNTINSLSDKTFTSASSITEERFNTTMVCDNPTDILITLPSANSVTVGFNITITKLNVGDITVENAPETNDVIRYAGWKFDTLKTLYMEDRLLSEFENTKLNGIPNLYSYPVSEFADKYTFKYTCISNSSYMLSI